MTELRAATERAASSTATSCQACGAGNLRTFYQAETVPVHSCVLFPDRKEALAYPTGDVLLALCGVCGFIQNVDFSPDLVDYTQDYEETQGFSPHFREFALGLAEHLVDRYQLQGKEILEIGCGKGDFLSLLCELGHSSGIGIDPAFIPERTPEEAIGQVTYIRDFYDDSSDFSADFVLSRHTLEHIAPVREFVESMVSSLRSPSDSVLFIEVPDTSRVLEEAAFWDIYYEHCSYFTAGSLARLIRSVGLEVLDLRKDFGDQYLLAETRPGSGSATFEIEETVEQTEEQVDRFVAVAEEVRTGWIDRLRDAREEGRRTVLWGAGSKAVAFLTTLGLTDEVEMAVDINPYKQGMYLPRTGHEVVGPEELSRSTPDLVVIMNPVYEKEIGRDLADMDISAEVVSV